MNRSPKNGFRLAVYLDRDAIPESAFAFRQLGEPTGLRTQRPVPDAIFSVYRDLFSYDNTTLNARVDDRFESSGGWIREKVSFDAAYGDERIQAYLFIPTNSLPPFQTVIYFPGGAATWTTSSQDIENYYEFSMFLSFLVRNGRAVLFPVYKGTFERASPALRALHRRSESHAYTELLVQQIKDFRRSVDYLHSRPDIDSGKIAYYGMSWGGALGLIIPAVEDRLAASVLVAGGVPQRRTRPEASEISYVARVVTPTLMLNGRYDSIFDVNRRVKPAFDLLGTSPEHKRLILYDTDHLPPRTEYIKETLAWFDRYLGSVR